MNNIVESILQCFVGILVKFLYVIVTADLHNLVLSVLYEDSPARGPAVVYFVLLLMSSRFIS